MSKGPGLFLDFGKKAKDLLTKDYISDHKFSVSTYSESGVALTTSTLKKGGYTSGDVAARYIYKNTSADVKVDTESNISLEFQYFHHHASIATAVGLNQAPAIDFSVTLGTPTLLWE